VRCPIVTKTGANGIVVTAWRVLMTRSGQPERGSPRAASRTGQGASHRHCDRGPRPRRDEQWNPPMVRTSRARRTPCRQGNDFRNHGSPPCVARRPEDDARTQQYQARPSRVRAYAHSGSTRKAALVVRLALPRTRLRHTTAARPRLDAAERTCLAGTYRRAHGAARHASEHRVVR
jgi:hypothetical protein